MTEKAIRTCTWRDVFDEVQRVNKEMEKRFNNYFHIEPQINLHSALPWCKYSDPITVRTYWSSAIHEHLSEAYKFIEEVEEAYKYADTFKYNGYVIRHDYNEVRT